MHQIHDNGCLWGALKGNEEKETSTIPIMFYFFDLKNSWNMIASGSRKQHCGQQWNGGRFPYVPFLTFYILNHEEVLTAQHESKIKRKTLKHMAVC